MQPIYLASASERRHILLAQIQIPHEVLRLPPTEGEDEPRLEHEKAADYVCRTARDKAHQALDYMYAQALPERPILTADTSVILGEQIFGKPANEDDIYQTLRTLSGQTHEVHTAICLAYQTHLWEAVCISQVRFNVLTDQDIASYIQTGESMGKAGAYAIQGIAAQFIAYMQGSYSGIMGLPLYETAQLLRHLPAPYQPAIN